MFLYLVSYDLNRPGQAYTALSQRLAQLGAERVLYSQWMLRSGATAIALRDDLLRYMDPNDSILVADVSNSALAWRGLQAEIKSALNVT